MTAGGWPPTPPPQRPVAVELAALVLVGGGIIGISQLIGGAYVITGSLPAKAPILGVAFVVYVATVVVGVVVRTGRLWLAALNVAAITALLYLPAAAQAPILGLIVAHALAVAALLVARPWFSAMSAWRRPRARAGSVETS